MNESVRKVFGVEPPLNPNNFRNLYTLYSFDLSAQDENLVKNGVNIQLVIKKSSAEPLNAYCLILEHILNRKKIVYIYKNERVDIASEIRKHC